jgi:ferredoxin
MAYFIVNDRCNGCLACLQNCPANAIDFKDSGNERKLLHNMARCARCGNCWRICPQQAIEFDKMLANRWDEVVALDLVRCEVCGEILYTSAFRKTLADKTGGKEKPLCILHKEALILKVSTHFAGYKQGRRRDEVI